MEPKSNLESPLHLDEASTGLNGLKTAAGSQGYLYEYAPLTLKKLETHISRHSVLAVNCFAVSVLHFSHLQTRATSHCRPLSIS